MRWSETDRRSCSSLQAYDVEQETTYMHQYEYWCRTATRTYALKYLQSRQHTKLTSVGSWSSAWSLKVQLDCSGFPRLGLGQVFIMRWSFVSLEVNFWSKSMSKTCALVSTLSVRTQEMCLREVSHQILILAERRQSLMLLFFSQTTQEADSVLSGQPSSFNTILFLCITTTAINENN